MTKSHSKLSGLLNYLVREGHLDLIKARKAEALSKQKNIPITVFLGMKNYLSYSNLAKAVACYFNLPYVDLNYYDRETLPNNILAWELIEKNFVLPLCKQDEQLILGVTDPSLPNLNEIKFLTGLSLQIVIVEHDKLCQKIDLIRSHLLQDIIKNEEMEEIYSTSLNENKEDNFFSQSNTAPVVKFIDRLLQDAIQQKASDIHLEPNRDYYRIRYRIDGLLYEIGRQPIKFANYFTTRLKVMANLDISERRLPQDGRIMTHFTQTLTDLRLSICPTIHGEKAVIRILATRPGSLDINALGMNSLQQTVFCDAMSLPQGLILVTGPTGSGKTNTLYTALNRLNIDAVNICSVEDPVEIQLAGINQVQINPKAGLTFAKTLRAFLRQDPDIIMIGEIRDSETAEIAVKAAQTGHLVFSTLHTNSAVETINRLAAMDIASYDLASALVLILAQRLIRCLCECKQKAEVTLTALLQAGFQREEVGDVIVYKPNGCNQCYQGYKGQLGIYEVLPISKSMKSLIQKKSDSLTLFEQSNLENIASLRKSALDKVSQGLTSLEEVDRVLGEIKWQTN